MSCTTRVPSVDVDATGLKGDAAESKFKVGALKKIKAAIEEKLTRQIELLLHNNEGGDDQDLAILKLVRRLHTDLRRVDNELRLTRKLMSRFQTPLQSTCDSATLMAPSSTPPINTRSYAVGLHSNEKCSVATTKKDSWSTPTFRHQALDVSMTTDPLKQSFEIQNRIIRKILSGPSTTKSKAGHLSESASLREVDNILSSKPAVFGELGASVRKSLQLQANDDLKKVLRFEDTTITEPEPVVPSNSDSNPNPRAPLQTIDINRVEFTPAKMVPAVPVLESTSTSTSTLPTTDAKPRTVRREWTAKSVSVTPENALSKPRAPTSNLRKKTASKGRSRPVSANITPPPSRTLSDHRQPVDHASDTDLHSLRTIPLFMSTSPNKIDSVVTLSDLNASPSLGNLLSNVDWSMEEDTVTVTLEDSPPRDQPPNVSAFSVHLDVNSHVTDAGSTSRQAVAGSKEVSREVGSPCTPKFRPVSAAATFPNRVGQETRKTVAASIRKQVKRIPGAGSSGHLDSPLSLPFSPIPHIKSEHGFLS